MGELEPEIRQEPLAQDVVALREAYAVEVAALEAILQPRLDGHLLVFQQAIDRLIEFHAAIVEESNVEIQGRTRWSAIWEVAGRCLALSNLFVAELRLGFTAETAGTIRVLDEAVHLVHAIAGDDGTLTRRWLDGETIMPRESRQVEAAIQASARDALREQGVALEGDIVDLGRDVYHLLSQAAHNARPGFAESVSRQLRVFNYASHPDPRQRAIYVDYGSELIESAVIAVGNALARFLGGDWYRDTVRPLQEELEAVRQALPIDAAARAVFGFA